MTVAPSGTHGGGHHYHTITIYKFSEQSVKTTINCRRTQGIQLYQREKNNHVQCTTKNKIQLPHVIQIDIFYVLRKTFVFSMLVAVVEKIARKSFLGEIQCIFVDVTLIKQTKVLVVFLLQKVHILYNIKEINTSLVFVTLYLIVLLLKQIISSVVSAVFLLFLF